MRTRRNRAFSLIEMIVVMVITVTLAGAIYATFAQGLRLWSRGSTDRGDWKVDLFLERLTEQIRNAVEDPRWRMTGSKVMLDLATMTSEKEIAQPVYLRYAFDTGQQVLGARRFELADLSSKKLAAWPLMTVLEKVSNFELEYYAFDTKAKKYRWFSKWAGDCFPETVKIAIELQGDQKKRAIRMIDMPTGRVCRG